MDGDSRDHERPANFEGGQDIRDRAFDYACRVVDFCQELSEGRLVGRLMVSQLLNCSLTFASSLEEAKAAESDADFISKCCISLKENRESWMRMRVCERCKLGPQREAVALVQDGNELISIVTMIIRKKRRSAEAKRAEKKAERLAKRVRAKSAAAQSRARIPNS